MQTKSKILEDIAQLGLGGLGLMKGIKQEVKRGIKAKSLSSDKDSGQVLREEFRIFTKIIQENKIKIDELERRVAELESTK